METGDAISPEWRIPSGFPEDYTKALTELEWAVTALGVAIRSHQHELGRPLKDATPQSVEQSRLAATISAANLTDAFTRLEEAQAKVRAHNDLVGRALIRCESYDSANP